MIVIPVDIGRPIKGYSSAEAAIAAAKGHPRQEKAQADEELLAGQLFVGGRASFSRWCLEFTGSLWVDIIAQDDEVDWRVTHEAPVFEHLSEPYTLRWPSGADPVTDPARMFADRAGAPFWQLWVNELGFYVYLRRKLILCFHPVRRVDDGSCVLSVFEDD
ncbi:MAG: hypothetical protein ACFCVE_08575 [Phycisphaerae bacterium]